MKIKALALVAALLIAAPSFAAPSGITALKAKFGAGGFKSNKSGTVLVKVAATGTAVAGEKVVIQWSKDQKAPWTRISPRSRALSATGTATFSFANKAAYGCFRVITAANGNSNADVTSNKVCEK